MTTPTYNFDRLGSKWILVAIALGFMILALVLGIDRPLIEFFDHITAQYATYGLNFIQAGYLRSRFLNIYEILPDDSLTLYVRRPPFVGLILSLSYWLFGVGEWSTRLVGLFFGLGALTACYAIFRQIYGKTIAILGSFFFAFFPGNVAFLGHGVYPESLGFALALILLFLYLAWLKHGLKWLLACVFISCVVGILSDWSFIGMPAIILLHWFLFGRKKRPETPPLLLGGMALLCGILLVGYLAFITFLVNQDGIYTTFPISESINRRLYVSSNPLQDYTQMTRVFVVYTLYHYPLAVLGLGLVGMVKRKALDRDQWFWLWGLLIYGIHYFIILRGQLRGHWFLMLLTAPFFALIAARGLAQLLSAVKSIRQQIAALAVVALVFGIGSTLRVVAFLYPPDTLWESHYGGTEYSQETQHMVQAAEDTAALTPAGSNILVGFHTGGYLGRFYLNRDHRYHESCITSIEAFEEARSQYAFDYYIYNPTLLPDPVCPSPTLEDGLLAIVEAQSIDIVTEDGYEIYRLAPSRRTIP